MKLQEFGTYVLMREHGDQAQVERASYGYWYPRSLFIFQRAEPATTFVALVPGHVIRGAIFPLSQARSWAIKARGENDHS